MKNPGEIVRPEPSPEVARHVARIRRFLKANPRKPAEPAPRRRRIANAARARVVESLERVRKVAYCRRNPHVAHDDLVQEGAMANLEAARAEGADLSPDRCVRRARVRMNRAVREARRQLPGCLDADLIPGTDGRTPLDRAGEDDALVYGRGMLDRRPDLDRLMLRLSRRERLVLVLRFGLDGRETLSREDIGWALGISDSRVHSIEQGAIARLRELAQDGAVVGTQAA